MWLNVCGFNYGEVGKKGVYFDGHERDDVKVHRMQYIKKQRLKHQQYVRFDGERLDDPDYRKSNPKPLVESSSWCFWFERRQIEREVYRRRPTQQRSSSNGAIAVNLSSSAKSIKMEVIVNGLIPHPQ